MIESYRCDNCDAVVKNVYKYKNFELCEECNKRYEEIYIKGHTKIELELDQFLEKVQKEFPKIFEGNFNIALVCKEKRYRK